MCVCGGPDRFRSGELSFLLGQAVDGCLQLRKLDIYAGKLFFTKAMSGFQPRTTASRVLATSQTTQLFFSAGKVEELSDM